jgi:hypothetical protein
MNVRRTYEILHIATGLILDVARGDLGHPDLPDLWDTLRSKPIPPGVLQCLVCRSLDPATPQWVHLCECTIRHPVHFTKTIKDHGRHPESAEHLALKERVAAAGERHGLTAEIESRSADGSHVGDLVLRGGVTPLNFEPQLSAEPRQKTRRRNAVRVKAGLQPMWVGTNQHAAFVDAVPWAAIPRQDASYIARGEELRVTGGAYRLVFEECGHDGQPCPKGKPDERSQRGWRFCTRRHLYPELIRPGLDDLVVGAALGRYRSLEIRGRQRTNFRWLTEQDYQRWTGENGTPETTPPARLRPPAQRRPVHRWTPPPTAYDTPPQPAPGQCSAGWQACGAPARLYPAGWRCELHEPSTPSYQGPPA